MAKLTKDDLEKEAEAALRIFSLVDMPNKDMMTVLFKAKHHGIIKGYRRVESGLKFGGSFDPQTGILEITEATFCALNSMPQMAEPREVVAHELGHAWLGHKRYRNFTRVQEATVNPVFFDEWQTNYFAGAFLIPARSVRFHAGLTAPALAFEFNTTFRFAAERLKSLQRLHQRSSAVQRKLPEAVTALLASKKFYLRTPCRHCGRPSVYKSAGRLICDSSDCGREN